LAQIITWHYCGRFGLNSLREKLRLKFERKEMKFEALKMGMIPEEHKQHIKEELEKSLQGAVRLIVFTQETECQFCKQTRELVEEVATLSDKITAEVYDLVKDNEKAKEYRVDKVPAIAIVGNKDYGIRIYGIPYGYEFNPFIETIINVSKWTTDLSEETKKKLKSIDKPVHIQVFVTLTCPYCPIVSSLAHKFAIENDLIRADIIEAGEFLHLVQKYSVMGVPKAVINEQIEYVGALPEEKFLQQVLLAQKPSNMYI
jgi:glutaredoxin-like protein